MYYLEELTVNKMIVHILDPSLSVPILSMEEMSGSTDAQDFFASHIIKTMNDDALKTCSFDETYNMFLVYLKEYLQNEEQFVLFSTNIASQLFDIMSVNQVIPAGDLAIVGFHYNGIAYIAILKMNYQNTYIHYTDFENEVHINNIIQHKTTLPNINQRISEAMIINLSTLDVGILEKSYEIEGSKENYLSKRFLKCKTKLSSKQQYGIVKKATDEIAKKYFDENIEKKMAIKKELFESIEETGSINLTKFANEIFQTQEDVKEAFMENMEKQGLTEPTIQLQEKTISRSFDKQRIKTDQGIEIKIPMALYNDPNSVEFINHPDGKISIVIKNIGKIIG
ncbi:MAG: nucleoid-associated protein [Vallitaleaceae bacterium]|nr:nucleoid-associated protein [Vallitaleaceae bacterium]